MTQAPPPHDDPFEVLARTRLEIDELALRAPSQELARRIADARAPRRSRRIAIGLAALAVAVPATAAATGAWDLRTGLFGQPDTYTEDVDRSEWLNLCSPQYADVVAGHRPTTDLPAGYSWGEAERAQVEQARTHEACAPGGSGVQIQETGIDVAFAAYAKCAWLTHGVAADRAGEDERRRAAGQALASLANSDLNHAIDGGGIVAMDNRVADAVLAGDLSDPVVRSYRRANCGGGE